MQPQLQSESNLYLWCFTYRCSTSCIFKSITVLDGISFMLTFLNMTLMYARNSSLLYLLAMTLSVVFLYCSIKAWILFCSYSSNLTSGKVASKTTEYLAIRKWFVFAEFLLALVVPGMVLLTGFAIAYQQGTSENDRSTVIASTIISASIKCLGYLTTGWLLFGLQKSLTEATAIMTCPESLVNNQVV